MASKPEQQWYVIGEPRKGPYTAKELQDLVKREEIKPTDRLAEAEPKNPIEAVEATVMDVIKSQSNDPTLRLFEALQFARKKKSDPFYDPHSTQEVDATHPKPPKMAFWIVFGSAAATLSLILWFILSFKNSDSNLQAENTQPAKAAAPYTPPVKTVTAPPPAQVQAVPPAPAFRPNSTPPTYSNTGPASQPGATQRSLQSMPASTPPQTSPVNGNSENQNDSADSRDNRDSDPPRNDDADSRQNDTYDNSQNN